jgi:N-acyl-D-amino-acid deacylase
VVFDLDRIGDRATYADPQRYPAGVRAVLVNGRIVVRDGAHLGERPGAVLRAGPSRY